MSINTAFKKFKEFQPTFRHLIPAALEIYLTPVKLKFHKINFRKFKLGDVTSYVFLIATLAGGWSIVVGHFIESKTLMMIGGVLCVPFIVVYIVLILLSWNESDWGDM